MSAAVAGPARLFEAFFWIDPVREAKTKPFTRTKCTWFYPADVSHVTSEFRSIPEFCFPDLDVIRIERPDFTKNDYFTFSLTDSTGARVYGICLRVFAHGEGRRYEVRRRAKSCLCIITRCPFFSMFYSVLAEIHSLCLLEYNVQSSKALLDKILKSKVPLSGEQLRIPRCADLPIQMDLVLSTPRLAGHNHLEVPLLPLLEALGVERFLFLLSALMTEKRMIFVADGLETLSSLVLAASCMLYPFQWQHIFIPLLPSKLVSYTAAPMPYIIGVRRSQLPIVRKEAIEDVIIIDLDSGDIQELGGAKIVDFIGDSGSALRQTADQLQRAKEKASSVASSVWSWASSSTPTKQAASDSSTPTQKRNRDLLMEIIADLRNVIATKPGSLNSLTAVAGSILGGSSEVNKSKWAAEGERSVRESLLLFMTYLFYDIDDLIAQRAIELRRGLKSSAPRGAGAAEAEFSGSDSRASFSMQAYFDHHRYMNNTPAVMNFLRTFVHSQMFERFCANRLSKHARKDEEFSLNDTSTGDDDQEYDRACLEVKSKQVASTVTNVKLAVQQLRRFGSFASQHMSEEEGDAMKFMEFHELTLQVTSAKASDSDIGVYAERICADCCCSENFHCIMRTISYRLSDINTKQASSALQLLHILILSGPENVLSESLNLIPKLRLMLDPSNYRTASSLDYFTSGNGSQAQAVMRPKAQAVLSLLFDQAKLSKQRKWSELWRHGAYDHMRYYPPKKELLTGTAFSAKFLPSMAVIHEAFRPPRVCSADHAAPAATISTLNTGGTAVVENLIDLDPF